MSEAQETIEPADLRGLSRKELESFARRLGLSPSDELSHGELISLVQQRQALLEELDEEALRDVLRWAGRGDCPSLSKGRMVREIAGIEKMRFEGLTHRGLVAYARLRGVAAASDQSADVIISRIKKAETLGQFVRRKRRALMGSLISKLVTKAAEAGPPSDEPEDAGPAPGEPSLSLKHEIEDQGVVEGLARRLRGAADDYVREKLDEIELRIDRKLDEIDRRLAEWRDREVANRLRIIRLTLLVTVIVALVSLGYSYVKERSLSSPGGGAVSQMAPATPPASGPTDPTG